MVIPDWDIKDLLYRIDEWQRNQRPHMSVFRTMVRAAETIKDLVADRDKLLKHVEDLSRSEVCSFQYMCNEGETCREARTRTQGVPCPGCYVCEARAYLAMRV